jgi:hypothetical protein
MRVPRPSASNVRRLAIAALAIAASAGCVAQPPIAVSYDQREDLSRFRTWDWIEGQAVLVRAPFGDTEQVQLELSGLVERALRERGLAYAPGAGDLRVAALMVGTRNYQTFRRARALQTLHSYHDLGNYEVEGEDVERVPVDTCRVAIYLTGAQQERMVWQAVSHEQHDDGCAPHLDEAVRRLVEQFPARAGDAPDS